MAELDKNLQLQDDTGNAQAERGANNQQNANKTLAFESENAESTRSSIKDKFATLSVKGKIGLVSGLIILGLLLLFVIPPARYAALNMVASGRAEFLIVDQDSQQPIPEARIQVSSESGTTDDEGRVLLGDVAFGPQTASVDKTAYQSQEFEVVIEPAENFFGPIEMAPTGVPVNVRAINAISQEAISDFKVTLKDARVSAKPDDKGTALLSVPPPANREITLTVSAKGFYDGSTMLTVRPDMETNSVELTPAGKHYFLSNKSGTIDLFRSNFDGSQKEIIVEGTGKERPSVEFSVSPDGTYGAMISTRDGQRGPSGDLLPALYIVNFQEKTIKRVDEGAPHFDLVGWTHDKLVYTVRYNEYDSDTNHKIKSVTFADNKLRTHATAQSIRKPLKLGNSVFYALGNEQKEKYGTFRINLNNNEEEKIFKRNLYLRGRTGLNTASAVNNNDQQFYKLRDDGNLTEIDGNPGPILKSQFIKSDSGKLAWLETRDGKGTVIVDDKTVTSGINVTDIIRWINDRYIIFRSTEEGSEDFIVDVKTKNHIKITDSYSAPRTQDRFR